mmetsp:Transcript_3379/g.4573  ORF Transcript_3379/g.4573 Transcript_3379/m.4573 type:complete len:204 (-) Transcript_3379:374-985(-)
MPHPKNKHPTQKSRKPSIPAAPASPSSHAAPSQLHQESSEEWSRSRNSAPSPENIMPQKEANCLGGPGENFGLEPKYSITPVTIWPLRAMGDIPPPPRKRRVKSTNRKRTIQCIVLLPLKTAPNKATAKPCRPFMRMTRLSRVSGKLKSVDTTGVARTSAPVIRRDSWMLAPTSMADANMESSAWDCSRDLSSLHPPIKAPVM